MMQGDLRKEITVDAPPEKVFRALTDEKELVQWMPKEARMEARLGGRYEFRYHWAERGLDSSVSGSIIELIPGRKLSYTWEVAMATGSAAVSAGDAGGARPPSVVSWILEGLPDGRTKVTLVQTGLDGRFSRDAENGWDHFMGNLARHCEDP
jgi:uncharacterized protein YndB with AHSA1/START domain